jgi:hypothetical protein
MPLCTLSIVSPLRFSRSHLFDVLITFWLLCLLWGCGGGSGANGSSPTTGVSLTVSPVIAHVQPGKSQQFKALLSSTGAATEASWSVRGTGFAPDGYGSISSSGLYTAPTEAPNPNTVTIEAFGVADFSASGSGSAVIGSTAYDVTGMSISPLQPSVNTLGTLQFKATPQGSGAGSTGVQWYVAGERGGDPSVGTISATGLYTAPGQVWPPNTISVTAASDVDFAILAATPLTITPGPPVIKELTPSTANAPDPIQVLGENLYLSDGAAVAAVFSGPNGVPLPVVVGVESNSGPTELNIDVPLAAVSGPVYVQSQIPGAPAQTSNSVMFTRLPRARIRAAERDLTQGESTAFQSRILSGTGSETLTWTVDVGSVTNNGVYTAPATVTSDSFAVVTSCITGTQTCDQERLGLHPFRIIPDVPVVPLGGTVQLQAVQNGNPVNASWQLNGPGTLQSGGMYTASTVAANGGGIPITATYGGVTEPVSVAVTGGFNGLVNRVADYFNLLQTPTPLGTFAVDAGVIGNKAYVLATGQVDFALDNPYYWVDVYDLTDPIRPTWVDAFEPATRGHFLSCNGYSYQMAPIDFSQQSEVGVIATYDTSGSSAVLLSKQISPVFFPFIYGQDGCLFTQVTPGNVAGGPGEATLIDSLNLINGGVVHNQYPIMVPGQPGQMGGAVSNGQRMYARTPFDLYVYDLTEQPPGQIGSLSLEIGPSEGMTVMGNLLFEADEGGYKVESQVYDITNPQPNFLNYLALGPVSEVEGNLAVATSYNSGVQLVDVSNPEQPTIAGTLFDFLNPVPSTALGGNYLYENEGYGGLGVYDVSAGGGLVQSYLIDAGVGSKQVAGVPVVGQASNSQTLFLAVSASGLADEPGVLSFDLSTQPASYLGSFPTSPSLAQALALESTDLYVGTDDSLQVLDVSNPQNPNPIGLVNLPIYSLPITGTSLYAGTPDGRLVVFDVSQPSNPVQKTSLNLADVASQMTVSGTLLLVADFTGGLLIYDITMPSAPSLLSQTKPSSGVYDVAADGNLALLAGWEAGLVIVDLTNPSQPQVVGQIGVGNDQPYSVVPVLINKAYNVTLANKIAYIGVNNFDTSSFANNGQASIYGFDYTDPTKPRLVYLGAHDNEFVDDGILTLRTAGGKLFASTLYPMLLELDPTHPQNVINLSFLPASLVPPPNNDYAPLRASQRAKMLRKFKFDPQGHPSYSNQSRHRTVEPGFKRDLLTPED